MKNDTDEVLKHDIQSDIDALLNGNILLANMLNFYWKLLYLSTC